MATSEFILERLVSVLLRCGLLAGLLLGTVASNATTAPTLALGRFQLQLPAGFSVGLSEAKVRYATIYPEQNNTDFSRAWQQQLTQLPADPEWPLVGKILQQQSLTEPTTNLLLYHPDDNPGLVRWLALLQHQNGALIWFELDCDKDKAELWAERLHELISAWSPPSKTTAGFALLDGVIQLPFAWQESIHQRFNSPEGSLLVHTRTVAKVNPVSGWEISSQNLLLRQQGARIERSRSRKVAGLAGDELIYQQPGNKQKQYFGWFYQGKRKNALAPKFSIELELDGTLNPASLKLWDQLLNSVTPADQP